MADIKQTIVVDADTRATKQEFSSLRREIKREADAMGGDWEAAADKIEDALREAGARDDLIDAAQRIGREGPSEIEKMQRALRDLDDTAQDVAGDIKRAFGDNKLSGNDLLDANFKAEVAASARETGGEILGQISGALADGSIDADTLATSLSEGLVEIGSELGGPAGAAMVAGGLIASALWGQVTAQKEAVQSDVSSMFDAILTEGAQAAERAQLLTNIRELTEDQDKLNFSTELAKTLNADLSTVLRARAGDEQAMVDVTNAQDAALANLHESYEAGKISGDEYMRTSEDIRAATEDVTKDFDLERQGIDAARTATDAFTEASNAAAAQMIDTAAKTAVSTGQAQTFTATIDGVTRSIKVMPNGKVIDVTDNGSAELTQQQINDITGKDVSLTASMAVWQAQAAVDAAVRAIRPPTVTVRLSTGMRAV